MFKITSYIKTQKLHDEISWNGKLKIRYNAFIIWRNNLILFHATLRYTKKLDESLKMFTIHSLKSFQIIQKQENFPLEKHNAYG